MERAEKFKIDFYLSCLVPNLQTLTDALPTLDQTIALYDEDVKLRERINELAKSDGVSRFYAALVLWLVERSKAEEIFGLLRDDETTLTVQKSIGHGTVEIALYLLAGDFTEQKDFPGKNLSRIEELAKWKAAVATAKRRRGEIFDENSLPRYEEVLAAQTDAERLNNLHSRIEKLKLGNVAERFYAAALLQLFDEPEARKILESLLKDPAPVGILSGDVMLEFPASGIAAQLLEEGAPAETPAESRNPVARFFRWLGG